MVNSSGGGSGDSGASGGNGNSSGSGAKGSSGASGGNGNSSGSGGSVGSWADHNFLNAKTAKIVANELDSLYDAFGDDCKILSIFPPQILMELRPKNEDSEIHATLSVRFFPGYPYECPELLIIPSIPLSDDDTNNLMALVTEQANSNAREGRVMIHNLVEAATNFLSAIVPQPPLDESTSETSLAFVRYSGDYDEMGEIGGGAFGRVFRCTHKLDGEECVIKMVPFKQKNLDKTLREVIALRMLHHPNVVCYYKGWIEDGVRTPSASSDLSQHSDDPDDSTLFIPMEFCPTTLKAKIDKHLEKNDVLHFYKQLMVGLAYMHEKGVTHFDIKPDNLFIDESGVLKIGDFGLVALPGGQSRLGSTSSAYAWNTTYQAPEVIAKEANLTEKADMYSAGLVLLEMVCSPPTGYEKIELFKKAREGIFPDGMDDIIGIVMRNNLQNDPKDRLSASDILFTL